MKKQKQYKTSHRVYTAWDYEKEIEDLDRASEQGWQLLRGGCFRSRFRWAPEVRYRYQLDFQRVEDMGRYIETFREQGWEYISSSFNGWHYFRKLWDPSLPESAYEIFTDRESLGEMRRRWTRIAGGIALVLGLAAILSLVRLLRRPQLPALVQTLTLLFEAAFLLLGVCLMRRTAHGRRRRSGGVSFALCLGIMLLGCILGIVLAELRPNFTSDQRADEMEVIAEPQRFVCMEISYGDYYYLDLDMAAEAPLTFSVESDAGETVYVQRSERFAAKGIRVPLGRGRYWLCLSDFAGGPLRVECAVS